MVIRVLLDTSSRYEVWLDVSSSTLVKNTSEVGPVRSETCRANINFVYLTGLHIYYKMIYGPYNMKLIPLLKDISLKRTNYVFR